MTLRDAATSMVRPPSLSVLDRLMADHNSRADEIRDLLIGEPILPASAVAKAISAEFDVVVGTSSVQRWRSKQ